VRYAFPDAWWAVALGVGLAVAAMAAFRVTHPPAGADPIVVISGNPDLWFVVFPVLTGSLILVATAVVYHRFTGSEYPIKSN